MTILPVIDPTSFRMIHGADFSCSASWMEEGSKGASSDKLVIVTGRMTTL
jgi:hypothetical protein